MKTYTFNLESKIGLIDSITVSEETKAKAKAKVIAAKQLKADFEKNFPKGNFSKTYIL